MRQELQLKIATILHKKIKKLLPCIGGSVGDVWHIIMDDASQYVIKMAKNHDLTLEARMLADLRAHITTPTVHYAESNMLIMNYIPHDSHQHNGQHSSKDYKKKYMQGYKDLAVQLAQLHQYQHSHYGYSYNTTLGRIIQINNYQHDWRCFYINQRVLPLTKQAYDAGYIDHNMVRHIEYIGSHIDSLLYNNKPPSLIHGDAWGGNILWQDHRFIALIDPAIYYADPEIEIAYMSLFDHIPPIFYEMYQEYHSLSDNFFKERIAVYHIYPLLLHIILYQASYPAMLRYKLEMLL